ncbi:putative non-ribosomal peptide synthase-like protein [Glonium stellatum]|uniref:Putative non-ribosomal peptide synthase-like protein n=1 Tax=Glonium stellatum TaxID=574774 RepID=A0A8E2JQH3_9PEZI|nr:putative non-ribosomal peptide synthase-like protein [Glonium stellatum]
MGLFYDLWAVIYKSVTFFRTVIHKLFSTNPPQTLFDLLHNTATLYPGNGIKFFDNGLACEPVTLSYTELLTQSQVNGEKLLNSGQVKFGQVVLLYFESHYPNLLWTWSVIAAGAIPAILSPLSSETKTRHGQLQNLHNLFDRPTVVTSNELASKFRDNSNLTVCSIEDIDAELPAPHSQIRNGASHASDDLAVILFTSGSTGHSKAVEFTHKQLIKSVIAKQRMHHVSSKMPFMAWNSFDHSANFCELHLNAMYVGAEQVMVPASEFVQRPEKFFETLSKGKIGYSFAPNFFLSSAVEAVTAQKQQPHLDLSGLRVLMVGGEANRTNVIAAADLLVQKFSGPAHVIKSAYGLSETCSACFYNLESPTYDLKHGNVFASVGKPLQGVELRISDDSKEYKSLPYNTSGRIQLRGDIIFKGYFNNSTANVDCMTSDGWFDTGDLGYQDSAGNLIISGRRKEILILNGNNYSSFELEHAVIGAGISGISPSYIASFSTMETSSQTEGVVILFNPTDNISGNQAEVRKIIDGINKACVAFCSKFPTAVIPLPKTEMPKSTIGKLSRQKLKEAYTVGAFDCYKLSTSNTAPESVEPLKTERQQIIAKILSQQAGRDIFTLGANSSIMHAGTDSLTYLRIKHELEQCLRISARIPMIMLLTADSIEDLDMRIDEFLRDPKHTSTSYEPVVVLRKNGKKIPLILLPPGGGEVLNWLDLVSQLPDRPIYAIRAKGLQPGEVAFESMEDMLNCYEEAIYRVQPQGPYCFFGLCFGGLVSFELAKRFEAKGHVVSFCGGIDNPPHMAVLNPQKSFKRFLLQLLAFHNIFSLREATRLEEEEYKDFSDEPEVFLNVILARFGKRTKDVDLDRDKIERWCGVLFKTIEMVVKYTPEGNINSYDVFLAAEPPDPSWPFELWKENVARWKEFAKNTDIYHVSGDHFTTLNMPHLQVLQEELQKAFEKRGV